MINKTSGIFRSLPLLVGTILIFIMFFVYLPLQPVDEFGFTNINSAELMISGDKLEAFSISGFFISHLIEFQHRFYPHVILASLSLVTGIKPDLLVLLPLPMFLAFLSLWLVLTTLTNTSDFHRMLFVLLFASTLSMYFLFEFYYISLGLALFLLLAYITFKLQANNTVYAAALYLPLFLAIVFSYYTAAFSAIILMFIQGLRSRRLALVIALAALFITSELLIYHQTAIEMAILNAGRSSSSQIAFNIQEYFKNLLSTTIQPSTYVTVDPYFTDPIVQTTGSLNRLLTILYIIASLSILLRSKRVTEILKHNSFLNVFSLFTVGMFEILIYLFMNFGVLLRVTFIALVIFMAYLWPFALNRKPKHERKMKIYYFLTLLAITSAVCMPILNFTRSIVFSMDYGGDYNAFYQKATPVCSFFVLNNGTLAYTDHFTAAVLTYKAISLDSKNNMQVIIIAEELPQLNRGYYILPSVKAFRAGWAGYIPSAELHATLTGKDIIYKSGFFTIYHI